MTSENAPQTLNLIWGAAALAVAINRSERQAFNLLETGQIPAKKVGGRWVVDPRRLAEFFSDEREAS